MYQATIRKELARIGRSSTDPRHVEGYIRIHYGTLDHLSAEEFRREVVVGATCVQHDGEDAAERLAVSYGL